MRRLSRFERRTSSGTSWPWDSCPTASRPIALPAAHDDRLRARPHAELAEDGRHLVTHRLLALAQPLGDRAVVEALRDEMQHLALCRRQCPLEGDVFEPLLR